MKKRHVEIIAGVGLLSFSILLFWFLWARDPAHQPPAPTPAAPVAIRAATLLTTLPGLEERAAETGAGIVCRAQAGQTAAIRRGERLSNGVLYLDVKVSPACYGWVRVDQLVNVPLATIYRY